MEGQTIKNTKTEAPATTGHNQPPDTDVDPLLERLHENHADLLTRKDKLLAAIERMPETIEDEDEETAGKMADFADQLTAFVKRADAVHDDEKAPFLSAGRTVDSFWHTLKDDIVKGKDKLTTVRKAYGDRKAAAEKRAREEAERIAREEAAEAQRKADEAARIAREEEAAAQARADEAARQEREAREQREREATEAAQAIEDEEDMEREIAHEEERKRLAAEEDARAAAAKKIAEDEAVIVKRESDARAQAAQDEADRARVAAEKAGKAADAKPAELGRTRGEYGGMTSLKQFWNKRNVDRATIDLEALRDHLPMDAIERAINSWINANKEDLRAGKQLDGVEIFEDTRL